jgi:hypothetical protein
MNLTQLKKKCSRPKKLWLEQWRAAITSTRIVCKSYARQVVFFQNIYSKPQSEKLMFKTNRLLFHVNCDKQNARFSLKMCFIVGEAEHYDRKPLRRVPC